VSIINSKRQYKTEAEMTVDGKDKYTAAANIEKNVNEEKDKQVSEQHFFF
jgi:hypothetical protein